jgi:hypothetical protein
MTDPTLTFNEAGYLVLDFGDFNQHWREPICPLCDKPIQWVLDMQSFTGPPVKAMAHARCTWRRSAFTNERKRACPDV